MTRLPPDDLDAAIEIAEDCLRTLRGARVFLTGCTGFFGVWLLETLLRARARIGLACELTVLSREPERFLRAHPYLAQAPGLCFVRGDVRAFELPLGEISHFVHGATTSAHETFRGEPPMSKFDTVTLGTRRVLEICQAKRVPDLLYVGSGAVYGRPKGDGQPIRETDETAPDPLDASSALGEAKRSAELFCAIAGASGALRVKVARCFSFVGPLLPLDIHYAIGNFLGDAIGGRAISLKGDGRPVRSYLYMSDLVAWLITILVRGASLRAYNVGSEDGRSLLEIASLVGRLAGVPVAMPEAPAPAPATAAADLYVPSTARARGELGLTQTVSLEEGIRRTLSFHGKPCASG